MLLAELLTGNLMDRAMMAAVGGLILELARTTEVLRDVCVAMFRRLRTFFLPLLLCFFFGGDFLTGSVVVSRCEFALKNTDLVEPEDMDEVSRVMLVAVEENLNFALSFCSMSPTLEHGSCASSSRESLRQSCAYTLPYKAFVESTLLELTTEESHKNIPESMMTPPSAVVVIFEPPAPSLTRALCWGLGVLFGGVCFGVSFRFALVFAVDRKSILELNHLYRTNVTGKSINPCKINAWTMVYEVHVGMTYSLDYIAWLKQDFSYF